MIPWYRYPQIELVKVRRLDFFPPPPDFSKMRSICLGSKTRTIGDPLMLSHLPEKLKARYPGLKVFIYPRGFNPVVFWKNPFVDGISCMPGKLYGDDTNEGFGHLMQLKEQYFKLPISKDPTPKLFVTSKEESWARAWIAENSSYSRSSFPLLLVHPFGHSWGKVLSKDLWEKGVSRWREKFRVGQIGIEGHPKIEGADFHFLAPKSRAFARRLFGMIKQADSFIGVNSGPMHVAKAFGVRSLILIEEGSAQEIFEMRSRYPYYVGRNWSKGFLYESLPHLNIPEHTPESIDRSLAEFVFGV